MPAQLRLLLLLLLLLLAGVILLWSQDGNQYMVVWDQQLLPGQVSAPMDYSAQPPEQVRWIWLWGG
jgi:hypothetical protein